MSSYQVKKVCPRCETQNEIEAVKCGSCGLDFSGRNVRFTTVVAEKTVALEQIEKTAQAPAVDLAKLNKNALYLYLDGYEEPLVVRDAREIILGRQTTNNKVPTIDLQPYQAYILGVSRNHAKVTRTGDTFYVEDLGSANGTRLNGSPLASYQQYAIQSGDQLEIGSLMAWVYYRVDSETSQSVRIELIHPTASFLTAKIIEQVVTPVLAALSEVHCLVDQARGKPCTEISAESIRVAPGPDLKIEMMLDRGKYTIDTVVKHLTQHRDPDILAHEVLKECLKTTSSEEVAPHVEKLLPHVKRLIDNPVTIQLA
jgi:hypothetical protein